MKKRTVNSTSKIPLRNIWIGIGLFLVMGVIVLLFIVKPPPPIPTPKLPNPNAFDTFRTAFSQQLDSDITDYAYQKKHTSGNKADREYTLAEKEAVLKENLPALDTLNTGLAQPYLNPPLRSVTGLTPYYADFRVLARLVNFEAKLKEERGDWNGAMNARLDCIQMGVQIPHGSSLIGALVGIAIQNMGRSGGGKLAPRLSAKEAKAATKRLEEILEHQANWSDTIQEEVWITQYNLESTLPPIPFVKAILINNSVGYLKGIRDNFKKPYAAHPPSPPIPFDPGSQALAGVFDKSNFKDALNRTQNATLLLELALQAHKLEKGRYPVSLSELSPSYLKHIPDDPFALAGALKYRSEGESYVLYSVGPDGKDDNGNPIDDPNSPEIKKNGFARYRPVITSVGDIVAGKNIQ